MRDRDVLKEFLGSLVSVKQADLEIEDGLAGDAEEEVARLDDAGMDRPDRHLEHALAFDLAEFVPLALKWRQNGFQIEVLAQRIDLGPVVVQRATARIGMSLELEAEQVLNLTLLPVHRPQSGGSREYPRL